MELDLTKLLNKISKHILPPIVLVPHILPTLVDKIFHFGKIIFNVFLEQWIWLYVFIFITLQCKMFVDVLKNIYVKLEYTIRKLPKFFCLIVLFCVIVSLKYMREGDFSFRDILMLWTLKQEVIMLNLFLHISKSMVKTLLIMVWKYPYLYTSFFNYLLDF